MPEEGHLRRLLPIVRGLHARGHEVHVFTHSRFLPQVTTAGGRFTDLFVTHHGLNSTHEAIFNRVPMLSYPFFWDQPGLAAKCQAFGIARPLSAAARGAVTAESATRAITGILQEHATIASCLEEARERELAVMAGRNQVLDQIAAIAGGFPVAPQGAPTGAWRPGRSPD